MDYCSMYYYGSHNSSLSEKNQKEEWEVEDEKDFPASNSINDNNNNNSDNNTIEVVLEAYTWFNQKMAIRNAEKTKQ